MTSRHTTLKKALQRQDSIPLSLAYQTYVLAALAVEAVESEEINVKYTTTEP